ncbi:Microtubule-associated protein, microtubule dynamics during spindle orientation, partial [Quaeritorhiza haematococci]
NIVGAGNNNLATHKHGHAEDEGDLASLLAVDFSLKALEILRMFVEVDGAEGVIDDIIPTLDHKTPKLVTACVTALKETVRLFGIPTVNPKPILKQLPKIFDHKDKN